MRRYITDKGNTITGGKDKPTTKPTSFMMTTKFLNILILKVEHHRQLARPQYLHFSVRGTKIHENWTKKGVESEYQHNRIRH
jgi:hypothetical protein